MSLHKRYLNCKDHLICIGYSNLRVKIMRGSNAVKKTQKTSFQNIKARYAVFCLNILGLT